MGPSPNALKYQIIGTLHAAAYLRGALPPPPLPPLPAALLAASAHVRCRPLRGQPPALH